ncbi:NRDE family protein [Leucobacter sp. GX24907]
MCTVIVEVPASEGTKVRILAIRDEDPHRLWDPPGEWWPNELPDVIGVRDRLAGGAWLAARPRAGGLSVILNRPENVDPAPGTTELESRGTIPLASVAGESLPERPNTQSFNLIEVQGPSVRLTQWDGDELRRTEVSPGVHMIAHRELDDTNTTRIATWLPEFSALAGLPDDAWRESWRAVLEQSAELPWEDDRAIIRDNSVHGFPTESELVCLGEVWDGGARVEWWLPERQNG